MNTIQEFKDTIKVLHKAKTRGHANHGWLDSHHTFSFARYYDEERMNFGLLRVLNDDIVAPGMGFGEHPHDNMEIVSIPLSGSLEHRDSENHQYIIRKGDVQIMSAGSGIRHSEFNHSRTDTVNFLQIWVFPKEKNIQPRYEQKSFKEADRENRFQVVVSPEKDSGSAWINQDAWVSLAKITMGHALNYTLHKPDHGVYFFVLEGALSIDGEKLSKRDGLGISGNDEFSVHADENSEILAIEVPMK